MTNDTPMTTGQALATHTVNFQETVRGFRLEFSDEASGFDRSGAPTGWIMFCHIDGELITATELREIAEKMDHMALTCGRGDRHD